MKYIDANRLKAEIERRIKEYDAIIESQPESNRAEQDAWKWAECKWVLNLIASLQQEQPSLPSNLDEAAEKYQSDARIHALDNTPIGTAKDAFIAGAEWMAGQFQKIEGDLVDWYETRDVEYCSGIRTHESFKVPSGFYIKKEERPQPFRGVESCNIAEDSLSLPR